MQKHQDEPDLFAGHEPVQSARAEKSADAETKSDGAFKTISETADMLSLPQHVLRFWETKFTQIKPLKLRGGRRYYRPQDIEILETIKTLLYKQGYTIKGARKAFSEAKRQKEPLMETPKKAKAAPAMDDTPLFKAKPVVADSADPKKKELASIHGELLRLREMVKNLPEMAQ